MPEEIVKYLIRVKSSGVSIDEARKTLLSSGWSAHDVDEAVKRVGSPGATSPSAKGGTRSALVAVVGVLFVVAAGAAAYFTSQLTKRPAPVQPAAPPAAASPVPSASQPASTSAASPTPSSPTSGGQDGAWIPYRLDQAGFSLEYPSGWSFYFQGDREAFFLTNEMLVVRQGVDPNTLEAFDDLEAVKDYVRVEFTMRGEENIETIIPSSPLPSLAEGSAVGAMMLGGKSGRFIKTRKPDGSGSLKIATQQPVAIFGMEVAYVVTVNAGNIDNPVIGEILGRVKIYEPQLGEVQQRALERARRMTRDSKRISDIKQLQTAFELYYNDQSRYPEGSQVIMGEGNATCLDERGFGFEKGACRGTVYMSLLPQNPSPGGSDYVYTRLNETSFNLEFSLEGDAGGLKAGVQCATENGIESKPCAAVVRSSSRPQEWDNLRNTPIY